MIRYAPTSPDTIEAHLRCDVCDSTAVFPGRTPSIALQIAIADGWLTSVAVGSAPTMIGEKCLTCQTEAA